MILLAVEHRMLERLTRCQRRALGDRSSRARRWQRVKQL